MGRWRSPHRGHHHILGGGIAHISPLCYTESEIPAALRAVGHTAVFRTRCRREREGERIRAAKRHIEPDTARHPAARNFKTISPQGDGNHHHQSPRKMIVNFKTISPQGDGNSNEVSSNTADPLKQFQNHIPARGRKQSAKGIVSVAVNVISKPYPRKGTETIPHRLSCVRVGNQFQNHIPARGRKLVEFFVQLHAKKISKPYPRKGTETIKSQFVPFLCRINFKTISPQGDGNY